MMINSILANSLGWIDMIFRSIQFFAPEVVSPRMSEEASSAMQRPINTQLSFPKSRDLFIMNMVAIMIILPTMMNKNCFMAFSGFSRYSTIRPMDHKNVAMSSTNRSRCLNSALKRLYSNKMSTQASTPKMSMI